MEPARPGRGSHQFIAPFSMKPVPGRMTPEGTPRVCVRETTIPSASTQDTVVVCSESAPVLGRRAFSPARMAAAHASA